MHESTLLRKCTLKCNHFSDQLGCEWDMKNKFEYWRSIEHKTQRNTDLENGYINSLDEFEPHDDEWA